MTENGFDSNLIVWYPFDDAESAFADQSGHHFDAVPKGTVLPEIKEVHGRRAAHFEGGVYGTSYLELPENLLTGVNDQTGITISTWVHCDKVNNVWERIFDFGQTAPGPYMFLTRFLRGVCFNGGDLVAASVKPCPEGEWVHVAMSITGTQGGTLSSAGPRVYLNGELMGDGFISQTSSGTYKKLREWFATLDDPANYSHNFIAHSQFDADSDFGGSLSDFRIYKAALSEEEIIGLMCESLSEDEILRLARDKFLPAPNKIITSDLILPSTLMEGKVSVKWSCDHSDLVSSTGSVSARKEAAGVVISATLTCGDSQLVKTFSATVLPETVSPYEITIHGDQEVLDISSTLFGLFYEDINNAADGGIYAELVQNRSFEEFNFEVYDPRSGENGTSAGRNHNPLRFWFGDLDKVTVKQTGGLNEHFGLTDPDTNPTYVTVAEGAYLYNHGFCDNNMECSMKIEEKESYHFSIWAKAEKETSIEVALLDDNDKQISNSITISIEGGNTWKKYTGAKLIAANSAMGQLGLHMQGEVSIDMVSLMPGNVWGAKEESSSDSAHTNFQRNENYRLRRDLVETLVDLHPTFLRFPGGCISEGSYIWDNVYDWKDSVGPVETRKENFNVWGYVMTLGLGYMEYFQLAEDLKAEPLPVMACGVLCQARSDYANPAGGKLQEKYIKNFTDLIDFAISTDFTNEWAALRRDMGHEEPFGLHYLGVGNENWGEEFFASFEEFKHAIDVHMEKNYPGYDLTIISTVGAQADDDAYQQGWKFLAGYKEGGAKVAFTDGTKSFEKDVTWYPNEKNYLATIADEHYYRDNEYLLENADRYNYYYRPYKNGSLVENQVSKVFVGEYASSDKNTLAGAVAEAAVMTGFEKNSDVVRLAATAPLFNKVVGDGQYRWTPDAIWFDNESVWKTPNYYVQQIFAKYIGKKLLQTSYKTYVDGKKIDMVPQGGLTVAMSNGEVTFKKLTVTSNKEGNILFQQDFTKPLDTALLEVGMEQAKAVQTDAGLTISCPESGRHGYYLNRPELKDYTVELEVEKQTENAEIYVGAGLTGVTDTEFVPEKISLHEYCVGCGSNGTGLKVIKDGKEGYTMGDYSSSVFAGNLRACYDKPVAPGNYTIQVVFGDTQIHCHYFDGTKEQAVLDCKLESYNRDVFHSVTRDEKHTYIKLVNADAFAKKVQINLDQISASSKADVITLTGDAKWVHTPNVNTKEVERIKPAYSTIPVSAEGFEIELSASSLTTIVL